MKSFARQVVQISEEMANRLEKALTHEIVIRPPTEENNHESSLFRNIAHPDRYKDQEINHLALSKADFNFLPAGLKPRALNDHKDFI